MSVLIIHRNPFEPFPYREWLAGRVRYFKARHGFTASSGFSHRHARNHGSAAGGGQTHPDALPVPTEQATLF